MQKLVMFLFGFVLGFASCFVWWLWDDEQRSQKAKEISERAAERAKEWERIAPSHVTVRDAPPDRTGWSHHVPLSQSSGVPMAPYSTREQEPWLP